jgi:hypothetical protein
MPYQDERDVALTIVGLAMLTFLAVIVFAGMITYMIVHRYG